MKYSIKHICSFVFLTLIGISYSPFELLGQTDKNATVRGIIYDGEEAGEPLIGGNVILNNGDGDNVGNNDDEVNHNWAELTRLL